VAAFAEGLSAEEHGAQLPSTVGVGWDAGKGPPSSVRRLPRTGGQRSQPDRRDHRQQDGQIGRKRGARIDPVGYDAGKKTKGVKYHILVDTLGLLAMVIVHAANIQDRDGAALVLDKRTRAMFPFITKVFADGGYQGERVAALLRDTGTWTLDIVKRSDAGKGFHVLPKRWIVERTLAWISRCRRLARNLENLAKTSLALIRLAMIKLMARRLTRQ
jgi:transposase